MIFLWCWVRRWGGDFPGIWGYSQCLLASQLLGVPDNLLTQGAVILIMTAIFGTSAYPDLKRGIKILADVNLWLMYFVMAFVVLLGPTVYILSLSMNSIGLMMDNFFRISFWTDRFKRFSEAWTIFTGPGGLPTRR